MRWFWRRAPKPDQTCPAGGLHEWESGEAFDSTWAVQSYDWCPKCGRTEVR